MQINFMRILCILMEKSIAVNSRLFAKVARKIEPHRFGDDFEILGGHFELRKAKSGPLMRLLQPRH